MLVHYERPEGEERDIEHLIENSSDSDDSANNTEFDDKPVCPHQWPSQSVLINSLQLGVAFFIPPENRKLKDFLVFLGGIGKQHRAVIG